MADTSKTAAAKPAAKQDGPSGADATAPAAGKPADATKPADSGSKEGITNTESVVTGVDPESDPKPDPSVAKAPAGPGTDEYAKEYAEVLQQLQSQPKPDESDEPAQEVYTPPADKDKK